MGILWKFCGNPLEIPWKSRVTPGSAPAAPGARRAIDGASRGELPREVDLARSHRGGIDCCARAPRIIQATVAFPPPTRKLVTVPAAGLRTERGFVKLAAAIRKISNASWWQ